MSLLLRFGKRAFLLIKRKALALSLTKRKASLLNLSGKRKRSYQIICFESLSWSQIITTIGHSSIQWFSRWCRSWLALHQDLFSKLLSFSFSFKNSRRIFAAPLLLCSVFGGTNSLLFSCNSSSEMEAKRRFILRQLQVKTAWNDLNDVRIHSHVMNYQDSNSLKRLRTTTSLFYCFDIVNSAH